MENSSIKKNVLFNIIYTISNVLFPFLMFSFASKIINVDDMGKISFYTTLAGYFIMLASLGISTYGIRATAEKRDDKKELNKVAQELFLINMISSVIVVFLLLLSIPLVNKFKSDIYILLINCVYILMAPLGMNWLFSGLEKYSYIMKRNLVLKSLSLLLVILFVHTSNDYMIYLLILIFSYVSSFICNFIYAKKYISLKKEAKYNFSRHLKPVLMLFVSILAINVYTHLDTVMLGFFSGDEEVGYYTIAVYIKTALLTIVNSISAALLPRISYFYSNNSKMKMKEIISVTSSLIFTISIFLTLFFIITAKNCIFIIGGEKYYNSIICMQIIMPVLLFSGLSNITGNQILIPSGKDSSFMKAVVSGAIFDFVLNLVLIPKYGCIGAAMATVCAEFIQMSIQLYYTRDYFNVLFDYKNMIKIIFSITISSLLLIAFAKFLEAQMIINILKVLIYGVFSGFVYLLCLIALKEKHLCSILIKLRSMYEKNRIKK